MPLPLSAQLAADHCYQAAYHARMATEHRLRREDAAAVRHTLASRAQEEAAAAPFDQGLDNRAAVASARTDEASQREGWRTVIRPGGRSGLEPPKR